MPVRQARPIQTFNLTLDTLQKAQLDMPENNDTAPPSPAGLTYADAGVNIDAGNQLVDAIKPLIKATNRPGVVGGIGGFGGLLDLGATSYKDPYLVAANDGVGTKLKLALETGIHNTVGIDLTAMCVNDLVVQGAEPLFFLDYFACGELENGVAKQVIEGIAKGCQLAGCALIGGETAEMPGMYSKGDYDLAGFAVGAVEKSELLPKENLQAGDRILGLAASGVHSNGFSLVRKVIEHAGLAFDAAAPFAASQSFGEAFLTPTRIYVRSVLKALQTTEGIRALAHITGGGLIENLPRVLPAGLAAQIDLENLTPPPVFGWLKEAGKIADEEMLRTFNCGTGMVVIVDSAHVDEVVSVLEQEGETVQLIGEIVENDTPFTTVNQVSF